MSWLQDFIQIFTSNDTYGRKIKATLTPSDGTDILTNSDPTGGRRIKIELDQTIVSALTNASNTGVSLIEDPSGVLKTLVQGANISITDNGNGTITITSSSGYAIVVVANYSALPAANTVPSQFYWCSASQGTAWLPGSLGGTYYNSGLYYSNGVTWEYMETAYQATQAEVDIGTVTDQFVSPATFAGASKWFTKLTDSMNTNKLLGRYTAGVGAIEEITIGSGLTLTGAGTLNNTATPTPLGYYGAFSDVTDQFATVINTGYPMLLGVTDLSNQVTVVSGSRITIANTGIYNIQWSAQFTNPTAAEHDVTIWLRKNGVDVPGSSGIVLVPKKHGAFDGHILPSWNFLIDPIAGDYYEFVWSTTDTSVYISFEPAGNPPPSTASVVLTVTQQSGIMAGTGITAINTLTGSAQTLTTGTTGTDFAIVDSGVDHKFNLPTASASNRGALSSADWTTFNGKQNALGFTPVPDTRNLTINGTTYDLTADRSWTISTASNLEIKDEGITLTAAATSIDFTGSGVTATAIGNAVTVNVTGISSSTNLFAYYNFI